MCLIVEHGGDSTAHLAYQVFFDDAEGHASHGEVLLSAAVDHAVLAHIEGTAEDVRAHVSNHGHGAVVVLQDLRTIDGVVAGDMEVVGIRGDGEVLGDVGEVLVLAGSHLYDLAEELGLLLGLGSPNTSIQVGSLLLKEVVGDHAELQAGTTAEEDHAVTFGDVQQFLEQGDCFIHHGLEVLGTMAHFHQGQAAAFEIEAGSSGSLHHLAGKFAGAGIEIVLLHKNVEFMSNWVLKYLQMGHESL